MEFATQYILKALSDSKDILHRTGAENWNVPVSLPAAYGEGPSLRTPRPDAAYGLKLVQEAQGDADLESTADDADRRHSAARRMRALPVLSEQFVDEMAVLARVHANPNTISARKYAFPSIIFEAKTEMGSLVHAENQAAGAAAKALMMLRNLRVAAGRPAASNLPVVVVCSVGFIYELLIGYTVEAGNGNLLRVVSYGRATWDFEIADSANSNF